MFKSNRITASFLALLACLPLVSAGGCKPRPGKTAFGDFVAGVVSRLIATAFPFVVDWRRGPLYGMAIVKDLETDVGAATEKALGALTTELGVISSMVKESKAAVDQQFKDLTSHFAGVKGDSDEIKAKVEKHTADYALLVEKHASLVGKVEQLQRELDAPIFRGGADLKESDHKAAIELQRAKFLYNGGDAMQFKADEKNLVDIPSYRSALYKMMAVGLDSKQNVVRSFTDAEKKAFEASGMDAAFFIPEVLGMEVDCNILCSQMIDLYQPVMVQRSTFMYPKVLNYAAIGAYDCDAKCDAELGPEGNITYGNSKTYDWRGAFCLTKKVLSEANYDLLGFMTRSIVRAYGINRNRALITGDGINEPLGWLKADCFTKVSTGGIKFDHVMFRRFMASCPVEYGAVTATMHQNVFAYLASMTDAEGRFIFGDGLMTFSPDDVRERIRISNCLPDPTENNTVGNAAAPFTAGDFICAAGNWQMAYASVSKRPLFIEQYVGGSSAWCTKYQFGAEDGGFTTCCAAARTLSFG